MARLFTSGFELNTTSTSVEFTTTSGSPTIQSTVALDGTYSGKISSLSSLTPQLFSYQFASSNNNGPYFFRVAFRVDTLPSGDNTIIALVNGSSQRMGAIVLTSTGALKLIDNAGSQIGSNSSTLSTSTKYIIEIRFDNTGGVGHGILEGKLNGQVFAISTTYNPTSGLEILQVGGNLASESQTTGIWYFDDIAINDSSGSNQNSYPGNEKILRLLPNAAGDVNTFATQTGGTAGSSNNYTRVNEVTPDDATTLNGSNTLNQEDLFNVADSGIGVNDFVSNVQVGARFRNNIADATTAIKFEIEKAASGTITQSSAIIPNSTTWNTNAKAVPRTPPLTLYQDPSGANWLQSTLDTMQIGYKLTTGGTNRIEVTDIWAHVSYSPSDLRLDSVTTNNFTGGTTGGSFNVTVGSGNSNTKLLVNILVQDSNQTNHQTTSVTYNGVSLTKVTNSVADNGAGCRSEWWYLDSPATGTNSLTVTNNGSVNNIQVAAYSVFHAASGQPEAVGTATSTGTTNLSKTISTLSDKAWLFDGIMAEAVPSLAGGVNQQFSLQSQSFQNGKGSITVASPVNTYTSAYKLASSAAGALSVISVASTLSTNYTLTLTETITHTDTLVKGRVFSETITQTDSIIKTISRQLSETITHTDSLIKGRIFSETITYTDVILRLTNKLLTETITCTDTIIRSINRELDEVITYTDSLIKGRIFSETITFSDTILKLISRVFIETITHADTIVKTISRELDESITFTDIIIKTTSRELDEIITLSDVLIKGRIFIETITYTDTLLKLPGKLLSETITHTDTILKQTGRIFSETVTSTDIISKVLGKFYTETVASTDSILKTTSRELDEIITLSDVLLKQAGKVFTETITHTDTLLRIPGKILLETITHTDSLIRLPGKVFTETITHTDALLKSTGRILSESITLTDSFLKSTSKILSESVALTDFILRTPGKILTETITSNDSLLKLIGRTFSETVTSTDSILKLPGKVFTETITHTDIIIKIPTKILTENITLIDNFARILGKIYSESVTFTDAFNTFRGKFFLEIVTFTDTLFINLNGLDWFGKIKKVFQTALNKVWSSKKNSSYSQKQAENWYSKNRSTWEKDNDV